MLTEKENIEAEKQAEESKVVRLLLDYYNEAHVDGLKALRIALNKKLIDVSRDVESAKASSNDDKTFERIDRIVNSLSKLPKEETKKEEPVIAPKGHEGKVML